jgi:signal transduction histidine kinase
MGTGIIIKIVSQIYYTQMQEMIVMHPEQEMELKDSFHYYVSVMKSNIIHLGLSFVVSITFLLGLYYGTRLMKDKKKMKGVISDLKLISEQLEQYKKGNYQMIPSFDSPDNRFIKTEEWIKIEYSLRELGHYFSSLIERLDREENSTKSLITDISHQLKTPLASLKMSHELAQEMNLTDEERKEFLIKEEQEIQKLEILLEELVNLSRLENNMIQIKPELFSIKKTLTEAVNQVFMKAYSKDIKLQVDLEADINIYHDSKWTVEAISNVLDNAIKYSNTGTSIYIRVRRLANLALIEIEDEGIGIPVEELHKIYQRFYRGKNASSQVKEGAGIGLYLTRKILEEQGGTIVAKRKQKAGTIFCITFSI